LVVLVDQVDSAGSLQPGRGGSGSAPADPALPFGGEGAGVAAGLVKK
jgi:hypothetical protein